MEQLMTAKELADYLQVTVKKVRNMYKYDGMPNIKIGTTYRFEKEAVINWLKGENNES